MEYKKLTDEELDLASAFERLQMILYGNILDGATTETEDSEPKSFLTPQMETKIEIEINHLND